MELVAGSQPSLQKGAEKKASETGSLKTLHRLLAQAFCPSVNILYLFLKNRGVFCSVQTERFGEQSR